ncbi:hypothetical protein Acr_18g0006380 [Actinidia rufa]|uniref:Uncharacterized protein n=1 Tax=Actinidia rufa TaxID=165716 RepID=A0A7J0G6Q8_9ERIC|nr:hypothetical protein Acr_18g0006380 [Actinidia rufa]
MTADGVMGRVHGSWRDPQKDERESRDRRKDRNLVEIDQAKYSTSPKGEEETALWLWASSVEIAWRDPMLNVGLVLPRSKGFGDKQPSERSWATSSVMGEELNALRDTYSFPPGVRIRLPDEGETITSTCPGEVAFYEAAFPAGLRFSLHPTIRNLFSLNSNPKPDQGWLYFKARNKKVLFEGYPSNVKRWKRKFFFISGDEWELPEGTSRKSAPRVPRTWGISDKHCNNPPRLYGDEPKVFEEIFRLVEKSGRFSVPVLLDSKSYRRVFVSPGSRASRTAGDNLPSGEAPNSSRDMDESPNPHEQARRESPSRDDSIECLGSIRIELRRLLPHIPDLTLLRWSRGKVLDPILDHFMNASSSSSNPSSKSCLDSSLPVELESDAMSTRISFKKIGEKLGKSAGMSSGTLVLEKGVVIGEKRAGESITSSPSKKGKADDGSKGKGVASGPEGKKATSSNKAPATPTAASLHPGEGTSANLGTVLGPTASILGSPSVAERLLRGVILPADKEKVEKLTLDQTATKLFHVIGQALVLGSSLAVRSREAGEQASLQEGRVASMETEANDELAKMKSDRDSLTDKLERSGVLVNELREALKILLPNILARGLTSARCNFAGIIPTLLSILKAPWSIKICWRSRTRLLRRTKGKNWARTRG